MQHSEREINQHGARPVCEERERLRGKETDYPVCSPRGCQLRASLERMGDGRDEPADDANSRRGGCVSSWERVEQAQASWLSRIARRRHRRVGSERTLRREEDVKRRGWHRTKVSVVAGDNFSWVGLRVQEAALTGDSLEKEKAVKLLLLLSRSICECCCDCEGS